MLVFITHVLLKYLNNISFIYNQKYTTDVCACVC